MNRLQGYQWNSICLCCWEVLLFAQHSLSCKMSTSCYLLGLISKAIAAPVHAKAQSSFIFFTRGQGHKTWIEMIMLSLYYSTFLYSLLTTSFPKCVFPKGIKGKICFCLLDSEQFLGSPEEQKSFCIAQF